MALAGLSIAVAGCASTPAGPPPADAARVVASGFGLGTDTEACLEPAFAADDGSTAALALGGEATTAQRQRFLTSLEVCITPSDVADIVATGVAGGVSGTDADDEACLRAEVLALPADRRGVLLVGLALSGDGTVTRLDQDLSEITTTLFEACGVGSDAPGSGTGGPAEPPVAGDGSAVSTP